MSSFRRLFASPSRCLFLLLVIIPISIIPPSARAEGTSRIDLTPEEQAWLAEHPEIVLGAPTDYPPMAIKKRDGTHIGVLVDFFELLNKRLNSTFRLHIEDSWADIQEKAKNRQIDGLAFGGRDPNRAEIYSPTDVIFSTYFSVFGRSRGEYQLKTFSDLDGMRIGYKGAARPTRSLLEKLPSAILKPYDSHESMTQALLRRDIDVIVAWMSYDHWRKEKMQGTIDNILLIEEYPIEMVTHVRNDWPELIPILNKAIAALQQDELPRISNKWFGEWPQSYARRVSLTPEEEAWLAQNHTIRVRSDQHPPYFYLKDGKVVGLAVDLLHEVSEYSGITIQHGGQSHFPDLLKGLTEHTGPDLVSAIMPTPQREEVVLFTKPFITSPRYIFTRDDAPFVSSVENLYGETIAVVNGYVTHSYLAEKYPNIDLAVYNTADEALRAVSSGIAIAYIGDLISTPAIINKSGLKNLKASSPSGLPDHPLAMGVRSDWPELRDILDKALEAIPAADKAAIINRWTTVRIEHGVSMADVTKWALVVTGVVSGIVLLFVFWNKQLGIRVRERTHQLMESESRFRATFEQAAVGVAHVSLEGRFLRVNRKFCDITGYPEAKMLDLSFQDITHPDDLENDLDFVRQTMEGERETYSMDKRYLRKDGSIVWVNLTVSLLFEREGSPKYFVAVIKDISDRKRAEKALLESEGEKSTLREELIHATRRMAMGELTTAIAHEINQPLAAIMVNARTAIDSMKGGTLPPGEMEEILGDIIRDDRRAGDIIGKLRGLLKGGRKDFAPIRINEVVEEVLSLIRNDMLIRKITMENMLAKDIPPVSSDRIQLQQVFLNLILNAADALAKAENETRKISLMTQYKDNKEVWISISDTGPGFDDAVKDRLFDPFYTTKSEGMGVGLAICSTIVNQHGGRIEVESRKGGGATFHVVLPSAQEE